MVQRKAPTDASGRSGRVGAACASLARDERGQALPLLLLVVVFFVAAGVLFYQLALSTNYATTAQTAADAAALAAEKDVVEQLQQPWTFVNGTWTPPPIDWGAVKRQAAQYASDNGAVLDQMEPPVQEPWGWDVIVLVHTTKGLPATSVDAAQQAYAEARASTDPLSQSSPPTPISNDASLATGPRFVPHGGTYGFFPDAKANFSVGQEPEIAGSLDLFATKHKLTITGQTGYKASGSAANLTLESCGAAASVDGIPPDITDKELTDAGLERMSPPGAKPAEIALQGTTRSACAQGAPPTSASTSQPTPAVGNGDAHLVDVVNGGPQDPTISFFPGGGAAISGPWVIPTPIVMCESGGRNLTPNSAGASGYYQIIPSTWQLFGGTQFAPQAYMAPKSIQDLIAARIWNGGAGWANWDCAKIVQWRS